ncbi:hypothetical protein [Commensalibacter papalotli (ex Botero et al. 2024)]|uniref:hypothetical protein n=1 Tax=Commensalibacter papalotli (ex Botero et al. 2024) TaxID=2972766 RepID=UPI0022FFA472|nr:hypothetical protein [Commensalibacter papalotli (ex Botero et al. 2024)]CAI3933752.1 unnamed protein product [Commensalibacter papalotli (ex Botero et al. 2024)]
MSDQYKLTLYQALPNQFFFSFAKEINKNTIFHDFDVTINSVNCVYQTLLENKEILSWGGDFNLYQQSSEIFLTINEGNITEIKATIFKYSSNSTLILY